MNFHGQWMPVVDTHADSLGQVLSGQRTLRDFTGRGQLDFTRMAEIGHTLQCFSLWVEPDYKPERALSRLLQYVDAFWQEIQGQSATITPVLDLNDLKRVVRGPIMGALMSVEGAEALGTDPARVRILYRLGVRLMSLTWNQRNMLADGAGEDPGGGGLSQHGRAIVQEMNRVGIVLDVSHLAEAGFWDALEYSRNPVIASHSNCRGLQSHRRNLSDRQIRALASHGGVQGITFVREFLGGTQDLLRVVDHCLYALNVVGNDRHLGLGSDFDGVQIPVTGLEDVTKLTQLAEELSARGISDASIGRIFGYNYLEFWESAWSNEISDEPPIPQQKG